MLGLPLSQSVKALAVMHEEQMIMLLVRGDHQLNETKVSKLPGLNPFRFATEKEIEARIGCRPGYIGPVGLPKEIIVIADRSVAAMSDFVCGANEAGYHLTGVNFGRDLAEPALVADIRNVVAGDPSPDGTGRLEICRGIEVGHIFQLGSKYSKAMSATFLDESGKAQVMEMGCYGIGVSRIVAAAIEQGNDERGIIWPLPMAPFQVAIAPIGYRKNAEVKTVADRLHDELQAAGNRGAAGRPRRTSRRDVCRPGTDRHSPSHYRRRAWPEGWENRVSGQNRCLGESNRVAIGAEPPKIPGMTTREGLQARAAWCVWRA